MMGASSDIVVLRYSISGNGVAANDFVWSYVARASDHNLVKQRAYQNHDILSISAGKNWP